jgi:hypothetical protein
MRLGSYRLFALLVVGLALAFSAGLWASRQQPPGAAPGTAVRATWDYRVVTEPTPATGSVLAGAGADGWELVAVVRQDQYSGNTRQTNVYYYFKRARRTS